MARRQYILPGEYVQVPRCLKYYPGSTIKTTMIPRPRVLTRSSSLVDLETFIPITGMKTRITGVNTSFPKEFDDPNWAFSVPHGTPIEANLKDPSRWVEEINKHNNAVKAAVPFAWAGSDDEDEDDDDDAQELTAIMRAESPNWISIPYTVNYRGIRTDFPLLATEEIKAKYNHEERSADLIVSVWLPKGICGVQLKLDNKLKVRKFTEVTSRMGIVVTLSFAVDSDEKFSKLDLELNNINGNMHLIVDNVFEHVLEAPTNIVAAYYPNFLRSIVLYKLTILSESPPKVLWTNDKTGELFELPSTCNQRGFLYDIDAVSVEPEMSLTATIETSAGITRVFLPIPKAPKILFIDEMKLAGGYLSAILYYPDPDKSFVPVVVDKNGTELNSWVGTSLSKIRHKIIVKVTDVYGMITIKLGDKKVKFTVNPTKK